MKEIFNEIKDKIKKENNIELKYVTIINQGKFNVVIKVQDIKNEYYALRIAKNNEDIKESQADTYKNIRKLYNILKDIFPETITINTEIPYYILYEYFENNVFDYLKDKTEKNFDEFKNIINKCIEQINFVYEKNIRCIDIKPENFVIKIVHNNPIVKMIDIDDCFVKHIEEDEDEEDVEEHEYDKYKNFLLLLTFCQFYISFENKNILGNYVFNDDERKYIIEKIKERTKISDDDENKFNIIQNADHYYHNHYKFLNHYYRFFIKEEDITFNFIRRLFSESSLDCKETLSPSSLTCEEKLSPSSLTCEEKLSPDGKRLSIPKFKSPNLVLEKIFKQRSRKSKKRSRKSKKRRSKKRSKKRRSRK